MKLRKIYLETAKSYKLSEDKKFIEIQSISDEIYRFETDPYNRSVYKIFLDKIEKEKKEIDWQRRIQEEAHKCLFENNAESQFVKISVFDCL